MNWKEHAHLFANGKFKIEVESIYGKSENEVFDFIGWDNSKKEILIPNGNGTWINSEYSTLIARTIESMNESEIEQLYNYAPISTPENNHPTGEDIKEFCKDVVDGFLYLLSIGVYPFNQSHFGETVIDIKTL